MTDGVLVTGASGGLGSVTVPALLGAGFQVAGLARKWQQTSQADRFFAIAADLSTTEGASQAAQQATAAVAIEARNHHPEWFNVYNRVTVDLATHDAGGITQKDVDLAQLLEGIAAKLI
jgi:pterin-4a-carbinolamine dehydratase